MRQYLDILRYVRDNGIQKGDRMAPAQLKCLVRRRDTI